MNHGDPRLAKLEQRSQSILTLLVMVIVVLLVQMWLLSIALEEYMAARNALALPTFLVSVVCLLINLRLLKTLYDIDRQEDIE